MQKKSDFGRDLFLRAGDRGYFIRFGWQKVAFNFLIGKLHKTVPILFRCPKIRKSIAI